MRRLLEIPNLFVAGLFVALGSGISIAHATPLTIPSQSQKLTIKTKLLRGSGVLKSPLRVELSRGGLQWDYVPGTAVSIPFISLSLKNVPENDVTVLAERSGKLPPDKKDGYTLRFPLMRLASTLTFTLIDSLGHFEEWQVDVSLALKESAVFVDENCQSYFLRIKELTRPVGPNLIYIGCKGGARPQDLHLDILWPEIDRIDYMSRVVTADNSVVTLPLESHRRAEARLIGIHERGQRSSYSLDYEPYVPPPYEAWAGLAFFKTSFVQSNFPSAYKQISTAFLGQFWYRPEDVPISVMVRGFGSLLRFSQSFDPEQTGDESVSTYFMDAELRYRVLDRGGWRLDPFFGGWFFFMRVQSRRFGLQRVIDPVVGAVLQRNIGKRDYIGLTLRLVPLQSFLNPFNFRTDQSYVEFELTYVYPFKRRNRLFATLYSGRFDYAPDNGVRTTGDYFVLGGGYGW